VLAHNAAERGDGKKAARLLWATIIGALTFLVVKTFEWTDEIRHGFTIT
jgi:heme/copper-type cytochrome/quinol oxidase subunit 3